MMLRKMRQMLKEHHASRVISSVLKECEMQEGVTDVVVMGPQPASPKPRWHQGGELHVDQCDE